MASFNLLGQDNLNEEQHYPLGHMMHFMLALASCDADGIVKGTTAFVS